MINYLILHLLFIVYALNTVLGRMAAPYGWTDWRRFALLAGVLFLLGIYAAGWQVMLKKFNLGVAYANEKQYEKARMVLQRAVATGDAEAKENLRNVEGVIADL